MTESRFDLAQLGSLIEHIRTNPDAGQTVWRAETSWKQGLRSEATIRTHVVAMDEPQQLGGGDTAPNMVEIVLGAYGCCLTTGFVANAAALDIELSDIRISLEGDLDLHPFLGLSTPDEVWPGFTTVRVVVHLDSPSATRDQLQQLYDTVVPSSPVGSIITRPVKTETKLEVGAAAGNSA